MIAWGGGFAWCVAGGSKRQAALLCAAPIVLCMRAGAWFQSCLGMVVNSLSAAISVLYSIALHLTNLCSVLTTPGINRAAATTNMHALLQGHTECLGWSVYCRRVALPSFDAHCMLVLKGVNLQAGASRGALQRCVGMCNSRLVLRVRSFG